MEKHTVKILSANYLTHNVRHFVVEKPENFTYVPGQATDVSINKPGQAEELRPFTFTSLTDADYLEFVIKIYKDHDGVTAKLGDLKPGEELILHEVFGTINYKGPGIFIAGGAGITPFLAIFRSIQKTGDLNKCTLLFANHTENDIILKDELKAMLHDRFINILSDSKPGGHKKYINKELLAQFTGADDRYYYVCGPDKFTADIVNMLKELRLDEDKIVIEQ
ncbi:FAD-binding oxidoreductase [Mucilaginibacter ximonensis]|uniref:FAD-binding oxidoreductase n=1 Tax=Mucilaginibacter ximonensis TaxID=538021 RepID=A0ABW5YCF2_9SPHI